MADNVSMSSLEAVDECFDMLIKSRFIEMFGTLDSPKVPFKQLGDVATYVNGYAFKPTDWGAEGLPIIRIQNLSGSGDSFNYYSGTYPEDIEINKGDVMISWSATLGVFVWNGPKALLNQHIFKVYFDKMEVNPTYFRVAVEPALESSSSKVHGSTMTHLTKKTFDAIKIAMPPIDMQNEFGSFVEQVDKSKTVCKQIFRSLDNLVKSRFIEMFGSVRDNELHLPIKELGSVVEVRNGRDYKHIQNDNGQYPVYGSGGVMTYADEYLCPAETVIIGRKGTINNPILVHEKFWNVDTAFGMICDQSILNPIYFYWFCKNYDFEQHNKATTLPSLTKQDIQKIKLVVPDKPKQDAFATFVQQIDKSKFEVIQSLTKLMESVKPSE